MILFQWDFTGKLKIIINKLQWGPYKAPFFQLGGNIMFLADRYSIESFMDKFGWTGILFISGICLALLIVGMIIGSSLNAKYNKNEERDDGIK